MGGENVNSRVRRQGKCRGQETNGGKNSDEEKNCTWPERFHVSHSVV